MFAVVGLGWGGCNRGLVPAKITPTETCVAACVRERQMEARAASAIEADCEAECAARARARDAAAAPSGGD